MADGITIEGFLKRFKQRHETMPDRPFCWILGSGASFQSGIPTGRDLVMTWLTDLRDDKEPGRPIEEWATEKNLEIKGFDYSRAASFYPLIYHRRFHKFKDQGYAFLEKAMDHEEPSFGYSVLAQIMATTPHKVAITTNFDNLIADALSIYTRTFPLVCGHESLTGYIQPEKLRRPLIAKIHRDLLLAPLSDPEEIAKLPGEWATALTKIFDRFTPIVIGYGGNDGSLMGFLKELPPIEGGVFWCYREGDKIDPGIAEVVEHHRGDLVAIAGFDEVMLQLKETLQLPSLERDLKNVQDKRVADYQKQFDALIAKLRKPAASEAAEKAREPARKAAEAAVERLTKGKNWWAWRLKAKAEPDPVRQEAIYRAGLEEFPASVELTLIFAMFMEKVRKNYDEAERLYRKALELDPNYAGATANFAFFMGGVRKNYDEAARLHRKAVELNPLLESVGHAMMKIDDVVMFKMPAGRYEADITIKQLIDEGFEKDKSRPRNRLPILDAQGRGRYVLHRSTVDAFLAANKYDAPDKDESTLTLKDLLVEPKVKDYMLNSFVPLLEDATLADAKYLFDKIPLCFDILVTKDGTKSGIVVGWITNVMVLQAATI
jgi:tetratricopeptide (TPR) repeat protein